MWGKLKLKLAAPHPGNIFIAINLMRRSTRTLPKVAIGTLFLGGFAGWVGRRSLESDFVCLLKSCYNCCECAEILLNISTLSKVTMWLPGNLSEWAGNCGCGGCGGVCVAQFQWEVPRVESLENYTSFLLTLLIWTGTKFPVFPLRLPGTCKFNYTCCRLHLPSLIL